MDKPTVATPSREYNAASAKWPLVRALMGGTAAMREAGETYLPREPAEEREDYNRRVLRSTLFNGLRKTVNDMAGKVFAKPIDVGEDVPTQLVDFAENIDLAGKNLDIFAHDVFRDGLQAGIAYILTDMPPMLGEGATLADEKTAGIRPYLTHIPAEHLIGWQSETVQGKETLTQVRIRECVQEPDPENPWEKREVEQIRVLMPGAWQVWRKKEGSDSKGEWLLHSDGTTSLQKITLAPVYVNRTGFMTGEPPLDDLAEKNAQHWRCESDYQNILHVAQVPILFGSGIPQDAKGDFQIKVGSITMSTDPNAKLEWVGHDGAAIGLGRENLKDLEFHMQTMGLDLLIPKPGGQTATGEAMDQAAMNASLALMALALKDALEQSLGFMAEYIGLGEDAGGSLTVNTDFGVSMRDASDLTALAAALGSGAISKETYVSELQRRGVISDDIVPEDEVAKADAEAPDLLGEAMALKSAPAAPASGDAPSASGVPSAPGVDGALGAPAAAPAVDMDAIEAMLRKEIGAIQFPQAPTPAPVDPPVFNIHVDAPVITIPEQQPPVVNIAPAAISVEAPQITVEAPQITVNAPPEGPSETEVIEKDDRGGIKKFRKTPLA